MQIRNARPGDMNELRELYYGTITTINSKDYNEEQIKAWASTARQNRRFFKKNFRNNISLLQKIMTEKS